jgi:hypothetical protein
MGLQALIIYPYIHRLRLAPTFRTLLHHQQPARSRPFPFGTVSKIQDRGDTGLCTQVKSNVLSIHHERVATDNSPQHLLKRRSSDDVLSYQRQVSHDSTQRPRRSLIFSVSSREDASTLQESALPVAIPMSLLVSLTLAQSHPACPDLAGLHIECLVATRTGRDACQNTLLSFVRAIANRRERDYAVRCKIPVSATPQLSSLTKVSMAQRRRSQAFKHQTCSPISGQSPVHSPTIKPREFCVSNDGPDSLETCRFA